MSDPYVVAAVVTGTATLIASAVGAWASVSSSHHARQVNQKVETNHGGTIGEHMEDLLDWAVAHQGSDNEVREALGLEPVIIPVIRQRDRPEVDPDEAWRWRRVRRVR